MQHAIIAAHVYQSPAARELCARLRVEVTATEFDALQSEYKITFTSPNHRHPERLAYYSAGPERAASDAALAHLDRGAPLPAAIAAIERIEEPRLPARFEVIQLTEASGAKSSFIRAAAVEGAH